MYTQITYQELVEKSLSRIGGDFGITFETTSTVEMLTYPTGKWLYAIDSHMTIRVFRWGTAEEKEVYRFRLDESRDEFERRLDDEIRSAILRLHNIDAQELWQRLNLYKGGGHLLEMWSDGTEADGVTQHSETAFLASY